MKLKKLASAALAGALALSLSAPAFAAGVTPPAANTATSLEQNTSFSTTVQVPTINITVPSTGAVVINPYGMTVQNDAGDDVTNQIVSATQYIVNSSDVALNVDVTVTGTLPANKKDVKFATASTKGGTKVLTTNDIFMYFEIGSATANDGSGDPTWPTAYVAKPEATQAVKQVLVAAKATTAKNVLTLAAGNVDTTYAAFHLTGDVVSAPTRAWVADDAVSVAVAFTFTPTATVAATPSNP